MSTVPSHRTDMSPQPSFGSVPHPGMLRSHDGSQRGGGGGGGLPSSLPGGGSATQRSSQMSLNQVRASGRFKRMAHDHQPMLRWMDEMLSQKSLMVASGQRGGGGSGDGDDRRAVFRARSALNSSCFDKLSEQASAHSLKLAALLRKPVGSFRVRADYIRKPSGQSRAHVFLARQFAGVCGSVPAIHRPR